METRATSARIHAGGTIDPAPPARAALIDLDGATSASAEIASMNLARKELYLVSPSGWASSAGRVQSHTGCEAALTRLPPEIAMNPRRAALRLVKSLCLAVVAASPIRGETVVYARDLALSPDGNTLAFAWAGDLWSVPVDGGAARRLTAHPALDSAPVWSRDGKMIAFASDRHGASNLFVMTREGEDLRRLTFGDVSETPTDFSPDGQFVYYHARKAGEVEWMPRIYRVPVAGGQSWRVMNARGSDARISPDGDTMVFARGGERWWRTGYLGSANWDLWLRDHSSGTFRQLTNYAGADLWPTWSPDGRGVYFLSDRDETRTHNVWYQPLEGDARPVTQLTGRRVRDYCVSANGALLAYTQWDKLYVLPLPNGRAREIVVTATVDMQEEAVQRENLTTGADEAAASPDGKEVALVVRGEIYVIKTEEDKLTRRVTESPARDWQVTWSPDGKALFFISDRDGQENVYRATSAEQPAKALSDSLRFRIERVTDAPTTESRPLVSPDGQSILLVRGRGDLVRRDLKSGRESVLLAHWNTPTARWSPDSQWIAYELEDNEYNADIWIIPADAGQPAVNLSKHPDNEVNPQWSADGQIVSFASRRAGFDDDLYFVFLSPELEQKSTVDLNEYFKQAAEAAKKRKPLKDAVASGKIALAGEAPASASAPATTAESKPAADTQTLEQRLRALLKEILNEKESQPEPRAEDGEEKKPPAYAWDLATAWQRLRRVTSLPNDQSNYALSPDGALFAFVSSHEGQPALYSIQWNGRDVKELASGAAGGLEWSLDGKTLHYLAAGQPRSCTSSGGDKKTYAFRAKLAIDRNAQAAQKFADGARMLGLRWYHPTMNDLDWPALTAEHAGLALKTRTWDEFNEIFNLLQGLLNGSHQGIFGPSRDGGDRVGYLGCEFDATYAGPGLKVSAVLAKSPADRAESRLVVGDVILKLNGASVGPDRAVEAALIDLVGEPVIVEYLPSPERGPASQPASQSTSQPASAGPNAAGESQSASQPASAPSEARTVELVIRPISYGELNGLYYDAWVEANRKYVETNSQGRVAYAHIAGMGEPQFYTFERDLYAAAHGKDGLIIDVRNNGGGWTADWVMAVLNVRRHAYTIGRGGQEGYPQDRLIFYAWTKPATMMCNQFSYSNAEIVSHAFKNLGRGPLVGVTTWGAVISTGAYGLIDGARVRMPFRGWYTLPDRVNMELNGAEPTVRVEQGPDDEEQGREPQLDAAIRATLDQIAAQTESPGSPPASAPAAGAAANAP